MSGYAPFPQPANVPRSAGVFSSMTRTALKATILAAAIALVAPVAAANAATDGTSNTIMVAESVAHSEQLKWTFSDILVSSVTVPKAGFMDYTDDV
jgi:hypothetical protein